jgi:hypothetical protein
VAEACWKAFLAASETPEPAGGPGWADTPLDPRGPHALHFWPFLPAPLLVGLLGPPWLGELAYEHFTSEQWHAFIDKLPASELERASAAWRVIPEPLCAELLRSGRLEAEAVSAYRALWSRFPELLSRVHGERLGTDPLGSLAILLTAPNEHAEPLIAGLGRPRLLDLPPAVLQAVRGWLYERIARRSPGFRVAFGLFSELELALRPFAPR